LEQQPLEDLGFSPKLFRLPIHALLLPLPRKTAWIVSHIFYFPVLCLVSILSLLYARPTALLLKPRSGAQAYVCSRDIPTPVTHGAAEGNGERRRRGFVEISGYSFVGWGVIAVDDPMVIQHEFNHVQGWLGRYTPGKLAFNLIPLMVAGIFVTPLVGLGWISMALSLGLVFTFSLTAFVKVFH